MRFRRRGWAVFYTALALQFTSPSAACHSCLGVTVRTPSQSEARELNNAFLEARCFDLDSFGSCQQNLRNGECHLTTIAMRAQCNATCDLCLFKQSGELQALDLEYWRSPGGFDDDFLTVNITGTSAESSVHEENQTVTSLLDGDLTTHFTTLFSSEPFILVELGGFYLVNYVILINRWGEGISRKNTLSLNNATVLTILIDHLKTNQTSCGAVTRRDGLTLDRQTYRQTCPSKPLSTHIKLSKPGYDLLELSEVLVGVIEGAQQCGVSVVGQCDPNMDTQRCVKTEMEGWWHGKEITYTSRSCYTPRTTPNCSTLLNQLNPKWAHLGSGYVIDGAVDPNAFSMKTCRQLICEGGLCNGVRVRCCGAYLLLLVSFIWAAIN